MNPDQAEIERVLGGETAAYTALVERHQGRLLGLLVHACGSRETAEDISQETFVRAFRKLHLFEGRSSFYTWLCRVAMNILHSERRRKRMENQVRRESFDNAMLSAADSSAVERGMELAELQQGVHRALAMLDLDRRTVLLLRDFDGLDYDEIAETLDIPVGTVRSRIHRARLELKSILEAQLGPSGSADGAR
ncbi:MAG: sigma-70 family RNA polymerase sigma factor [Pirellulales bacterium]